MITGQGFNGNNLYVYCGDNPIRRKEDGNKWSLKTIVNNIATGTKKIGQNVASGAKKVGKVVTTGVKKVGESFSTGVSQVSSFISDVQKRITYEWGTGIGLGSSVSAGEVSVTFGAGNKNGESYSYRRDTASVLGWSTTLTDVNGKDANTKLFIFPWDKNAGNYDADITGLTSYDIGPVSFSSDGLVSMRFSFFFIAGFDFTIGYNFGDNIE